MGIEADYYSDAVTHWSEWYVEYTVNGANDRRPFSCAVNQATHAVTCGIRGTLNIESSVGVQAFQFSDGAGLVSQGHAYTQNVNAVSCIKQMNAAGATLKNILFLSAGDEVYVGDTGLPLRAQSGIIVLPEATAPAGAGNIAKVFCQDNGAGKTQLMVIFPSGVAQQLAIEA